MRILLLLIILPLVTFAQSGVGVDTDKPMQALHIAGASNKLRVDGLSELNPFNLGDINGDNNLENDTFPLYVNSEGNFNLEFNTLYISEDEDAIVTPTRLTLDPITDSDGNNQIEVYSVSVTTTRPSILEVKYNISFEVNKDDASNEITDYLSRRITNYFQVEIGGTPVTYGIASKNYMNSDTNAAQGTYYNVGRGYIELPVATTYTIRFFGEVSSGENYEETSVVFCSGIDSLLLKLY